MSVPPGTRFGPYEIVSLLGTGGMGEVYRALDTRLDRFVALKVVRPALAAEPGFRDRFRREARVVSRLSHPNVCALFDVGEEDGRPYLVMEFLQGATLAGPRATPLPLDEALGYAVQIADGLASAHAAGIVHRDLKPGNVMVVEAGRIKLLDFGLAKHLESEANAIETTAGAVSTPGMVVGTVAYMSPEQTLGGVVDQRSDIFSFGVLLYELLTGVRPFDGKTSFSTLQKINTEEPLEPRHYRLDIPDGLNTLIRRMLQKSPKARPQTMSEITKELRAMARSLGVADLPAPAVPRRFAPRRWKAGAAIAALIVLGAGAVFFSPALFNRVRPAPSSGPATAAIADSLDGSASELTLRARDLLRRYDKTGYLDRSIRLLEAALEKDAKFAPAYAALAEAYLRKGVGTADVHWVKLARDSANQAVAANPDLAMAHVSLADVHVEAGQNAEAKTEIDKALELDPLNSRATLSLAKLTAKSDPSHAASVFEKAIQLAPDDWVPLGEYGIFQFRSARYTEAAATFAKAEGAAPNNVRMLRNLAAAHQMLGDYEQSAATLQRALDVEPSAGTWNNLGIARFFQGRYADSGAAFERAVGLEATNYLYWGNLGDAYRWAPGQRNKAGDAYRRAIDLLRERLNRTPGDVEAIGRLAVYLAKTGEKDGALKEVDRLNALKNPTPVVHFKKALVYEILGNREGALRALHEAVSAGYALGEIRNEPELAALRTDLRYQRMLADLSRPAAPR